MARNAAFSLLFASLLAAPPALAQGPQDAAPQRAPLTDRGNLGVQLQALRPGQKEEGVRVNYIFPESAAKAMGFKVGDEILELNGIQVTDRKFVIGELAKENIGAKVSFRVRRGSETLELRGPMGSFQKTRKAYLDACRKELLGKPFTTSGELVWPGGKDGVQSQRGKLLVLVSFDNCQDCVRNKWGKIRGLAERFSKIDQGEKYLGFAGIYSNVNETYQANEAARDRVLSENPAQIPVAVARYAGDVIPADSAGRDPLVQDHGIALIDPEGKLLHLELSNVDLDSPQGTFAKAFQDAWTRYGPKAAPPAKKD